MKAILYDVVSFYHLLSGVSYCLEAGEARFIQVNLIKNLNGGYLYPECRVTVDGVTFDFVHVIEDGLSYGKFFVFLFWRILFFMGWPRQESDLYIGHHTYFKPTVLSGLSYSDLRKIRAFSFEEGVGTYGGLAHHIRAARREKRRFPLFKYLLRVLLQHRLFLDAQWGGIKNGDGNVVGAHYKALELLGFMYLDKKSGILSLLPSSESSRLVVFFSTPVVEIGLISALEYVGVMKSIQDSMLKRGYTVLFKLHPLERLQDELRAEGLNVIDAQIPAELLLYWMSPSLVAGFNSGALIVAKRVLNIDAIEFLDCLPDRAKTGLLYSGELEVLFRSCVVSSSCNG